MLRSVKEILGYKISTIDGKAGKCKDALFDDEKWTIRYLDIDTGSWLPGKRVLVSPISLGEPDWASQTISTQLSSQQIEESPALETDAPVSKNWEERYYKHHGWPHYAAGGYVWGFSAYPRELLNKEVEMNIVQPNTYDAHLRSISEVSGYAIRALDNYFGSVKDLIFDTETWAVRYLVIDTEKWLPSKSVLVSPEWTKEIDWKSKEFKIDLTKEQIKNSPSFDESKPINKEYEVRLYDFYGRPSYWEQGAVSK